MNTIEHQNQLKNLSAIQDILYNNDQQTPYTKPSTLSYTPSVQYSPKPIPKQGGYTFQKDGVKNQKLFDNNVDTEDDNDKMMEEAKQFMSKVVRSSLFIHFHHYFFKSLLSLRGLRIYIYIGE